MNISIDSILGGHSPTTHFGGKGQFRASMGIDPAQPIDDLDSAYSTIASALLRPSATEKYSGTTLNAAPLWQRTNPKDGNMYVYDALSSLYVVDAAFATLTPISDGGSLSNGLGNGLEYYDNYMYCAKNTTIARYGPLNGVQIFDGDYWGTTLAKTALSNTTYPTDYKAGILYPNHFLKRHSDGKLYIADVVGNRGTLHYIQTVKTTVEGDTNSGSTYSALQFGYGLWPTALETYGSDLAIALYEGGAASLKQTKAKLGFWDTTSTNFNKIMWVEFPDQMITAVKNVDGVLVVISGNYMSRGYRVTKFLGGYSFSEQFYVETGEPCFPDAIDAELMRTLIGTFTNVPENDGVVTSLGLQKTALGKGMFNVMRCTGGDASTVVTTVLCADNNEMGFLVPVIGWTKGSGTSKNGLDKQGTQYGNIANVWWSDTYRIGIPFSIDRMHIPLCQAMASGMILDITIFVDDGQGSFTGTTYGLGTINNASHGTKKNLSLPITNIRGENNFWIQVRWTGSTLLTVQLPITIEVNPIPE